MTHHRLVGMIVAALTVAACSDTPTSVDGDGPSFSVSAVGHRVSGSGHLQTDAGLREFTFHAVERPDGSVDGSYKVVLPNGLFFEADVTCLTVADNIGWVGGVIRDTNAGVIVVGSTTMFYGIDNGEGASAEPDVVSLALINRGEGQDFEFCRNQPRLADAFEIAVTDGNVDVR